MQRRPLGLGLLHAVLAEHRWPAAITGSIASAPNVFDTATSVTLAGSRARFAAGARDLLPHGRQVR